MSNKDVDEIKRVTSLLLEFFEMNEINYKVAVNSMSCLIVLIYKDSDKKFEFYKKEMREIINRAKKEWK